MKMTWAQSRIHRRFMRYFGMEYEGEAKQRETRKKLLDGCKLRSKTMLFYQRKELNPDSTQGMLLKAVPSSYIENLPTFVEKLLNEYDNAQQLVFDIIPDEIHVKIGSDHGGASHKVFLQIANLQSPNSKYNTVVIGCFYTKDIYENLIKIAKIFHNDINELKKMKWKGKRIRVFLFGDYAFLTSLYGLSGSCGIHPCLWCTVKKHQIQEGQADVTSYRTLKTLDEDYNRFCTECNKKKEKVSQFNNVLHPPLWRIPLARVCPPYLHILLGVVKKHHDLLEEHCHKIDLAIAQELASKQNNVEPQTLFEKYVYNLRKMNQKTSEKEKLVLELRWDENDETLPENEKKVLVNALKRQIRGLGKELKELSHITVLEQISGPVTANLEDVLLQHNIDINAYHGRSFIGNHCHRYLQSCVYTNLCESVTHKTHQLAENEAIRKSAKQVTKVF